MTDCALAGKVIISLDLEVRAAPRFRLTSFKTTQIMFTW